jgi:hypothetical protein
LRPSWNSQRGIARSCRLTHDAIELRPRDAQKKRRERRSSRVFKDGCVANLIGYLPTAWRTVFRM